MLRSCEEEIRVVFYAVIQDVDCTIIQGARTDEKQAQYFREGRSQLDGVTKRSKHQVTPESPLSRAVDAIAYPIDWKDRDRACLFAGFVLGIARAKGIEMISGIDWDFDFTTSDHNFFDGPHFELVDA